MENIGWKLDGKLVKLGKENVLLNWENNYFFMFFYNGCIFYGEVMNNGLEVGKFQIKLNYCVFELEKEGLFDELIVFLGLDKLKVCKLKQLKFLMFGCVVGVFVEIGQEVFFGDLLFILEVMKMENVLKVEGSGKVKVVFVDFQVVVEKGVVLIDFE